MPGEVIQASLEDEGPKEIVLVAPIGRPINMVAQPMRVGGGGVGRSGVRAAGRGRS